MGEGASDAGTTHSPLNDCIGVPGMIFRCATTFSSMKYTMSQVRQAKPPPRQGLKDSARIRKQPESYDMAPASAIAMPHVSSMPSPRCRVPEDHGCVLPESVFPFPRRSKDGLRTTTPRASQIPLVPGTRRAVQGWYPHAKRHPGTYYEPPVNTYVHKRQHHPPQPRIQFILQSEVQVVFPGPP